MSLLSVGMAVLWQTEGSPSKASGCPKTPEFRVLCESSGEWYFSDDLFQCPAGHGCRTS